MCVGRPAHGRSVRINQVPNRNPLLVLKIRLNVKMCRLFRRPDVTS